MSKKGEKKKKVKTPEIEYVEESSTSSLGSCIHEAEGMLERNKGDIERIKKMRETLLEIESKNFFEEHEIKEFQDSLNFHINLQKKNISLIVERLNQAKELWNEKNEYMGKLWSSQIVDAGVAENWRATTDSYENRILKLDEALKFWKEQ